jgi:ribosomal-protein-alanine N-acetyltransferase
VLEGSRRRERVSSSISRRRAGSEAWRLRLAQAADEEALHALFSLPEVYRFLADGAAPPRSIARGWIARSTSDFESTNTGLWLLETQGEHQLGGCVRLEPATEGSAELTYVLHPRDWGQGLATRMSSTVIHLAFKGGRIDRVTAGADLPNTASIAVMQRLGMTFLRNVQYPAGIGVEYELRRESTLPAIAPIPVQSNTDEPAPDFGPRDKQR